MTAEYWLPTETIMVRIESARQCSSIVMPNVRWTTFFIVRLFYHRGQGWTRNVKLFLQRVTEGTSRVSPDRRRRCEEMKKAPGVWKI